jgi:hypothetical protein
VLGVGSSFLNVGECTSEETTVIDKLHLGVAARANQCLLSHDLTHGNFKNMVTRCTLHSNNSMRDIHIQLLHFQWKSPVEQHLEEVFDLAVGDSKTI